MSQPNLVDPAGPAEVPAQKQRTNVYTVMLIISFFCIVTACVLLWLELNRWGSYPWWKTTEATPNTQVRYAVPLDAGAAPTFTV
ncbi:MAG: hypothetical protein ACC628_22585 [Pirellulaceae bacterium]